MTPEGLELMDAAVAPHAANETRLLAGLPPDDRAALNDLLAKLRAVLP